MLEISYAFKENYYRSDQLVREVIGKICSLERYFGETSCTISPLHKYLLSFQSENRALLPKILECNGLEANLLASNNEIGIVILSVFSLFVKCNSLLSLIS